MLHLGKASHTQPDLLAAAGWCLWCLPAGQHGAGGRDGLSEPPMEPLVLAVALAEAGEGCIHVLRSSGEQDTSSHIMEQQQDTEEKLG